MDFTPEQIERNREFIKDLRANEKKAKGRLWAQDGGRCCLGVACDTAKRLGLDLSESIMEFMPPEVVKDFFGWETVHPTIAGPEGLYGAACYNDGQEVDLIKLTELTHAQIADAFEATYPELKDVTNSDHSEQGADARPEGE